MYYVTMTDTFMSGWGLAKNKKNKLVFICDDMEQAQIVADNAAYRTDQKYINICVRAPRYNNKTHYTQYKTIEDYPSWYVKDNFKSLA